MSITEYDLLEMENITDYSKFNHSAKHISRMIGIQFVHSNGRIDYDLQELYMIKMFNRQHVFNESKKVNYEDFRKRFQDWVFMAIQDLGYRERANEYNYSPKLNILKSS